MAKERSESNCYQSRFGGGWITKGQWLAESMCDRFARSQGDSLYEKFWNDKYWQKKFLAQLKHANDLLKLFDVKDIVEALKHPDCKKVYSLGLKSAIEPLAERAAKKRKLSESITEKREAAPADYEDVQLENKTRPAFKSKKDLLSRLREIDGKENS